MKQHLPPIMFTDNHVYTVHTSSIVKLFTLHSYKDPDKGLQDRSGQFNINLQK